MTNSPIRMWSAAQSSARSRASASLLRRCYMSGDRSSTCSTGHCMGPRVAPRPVAYGPSRSRFHFRGSEPFWKATEERLKGDSASINTSALALPYASRRMHFRGGLGAVLEIDDKIVSFFADNVQDTDRTVLSLSDTGQSRDQQVLEALALLVALREWAPHWTNRRVQLSARSDNMAALAMVCRMQPHSDQMGIVAREMALDVCQSSISPDECIHIPGLANEAADALSRAFAPTPPPLPAYLGPELRHMCEERPRTWWRALPH